MVSNLVLNQLQYSASVTVIQYNAKPSLGVERKDKTLSVVSSDSSMPCLNVSKARKKYVNLSQAYNTYIMSAS